MTDLRTAAVAAGARLLAWAGRRARERSTWAGVPILLSALGYREAAGHLSDLVDVLTMVGILSGAGLAAATTSAHPAPAIAAAPLGPATSTNRSTTQGAFPMSILSAVRHILGIVAVAIAPTWNKAIANALAQSEAVLVPLLGDDAKRLCEDLLSSTLTGFEKLASVVADLAKIAADKGIKADAMVLTVIAAKAYAQVKADAPALLDAAIETGITAAAGPVAGALSAPVVEGVVAAATGTVEPIAA